MSLNEIRCDLEPLEEDPDNTPTGPKKIDSIAASCDCLQLRIRTNSVVNIKTFDNVVFRIEDFYLKANSDFFREMLSESIPSFSESRPIPIAENSEDFALMLKIIAGEPQQAVNQCTSWSQAEILYKVMQKYQLDRHQPWFTRVCKSWVTENPIAALILACNNSIFDEELAKAAIAVGFQERTGDEAFDAKYMLRDHRDQSTSYRKAFMLLPSNMTLRFYLDLGLKGALAYQKTFVQLSAGFPDWSGSAERFVGVIREIEAELESSRCIS
ncbi:hypothetical protein NliqN6_2887 [Naganishia liquefaciens]|uniref:BTB domain-containing protein n=1 Tax=Naganishia liquefaciens TaxID=104408 RepID=A0A8H3YEE8_9TREE|nr:hypothetical protein NliqN6_2887 [Naganishia liquefaciens]